MGGNLCFLGRFPPTSSTFFTIFFGNSRIKVYLCHEIYFRKNSTMNTITYNDQSQLIVTIDDISLVKKISEAVKLIKGVSSVYISNPKNNVLRSASYKAGMEDIKNGNLTSYSSSDEMFNDLMK